MSFYTEVITADPRFHTTERVSDIALLEPVTLLLAQKIIADAGAHGISLVIYETYRSQARQQLLFDQHVTELKQVGVHHYGLACDIVYNAGHGEPSWKGDFKLLGQLAHANKLIWGGDWGTPAAHHKLQDTDHVQRCTVGRQAALFRGEWYPDESYNPYHDL